MEKITMRTVRTDGGMITYQLERKQVKNVNLRIRKDGSVYVSANSKVSDEWIDNFVAENPVSMIESNPKLSNCLFLNLRYFKTSSSVAKPPSDATITFGTGE